MTVDNSQKRIQIEREMIAVRHRRDQARQDLNEERVLRSAIQMMTRFETKKNLSKFTRWYRYT